MKGGVAEKNPHPPPFPREQGKGDWVMRWSRWDCLSLFSERAISQKSRSIKETTKAPSLLAGRGLGVGFCLARDGSRTQRRLVGKD